MEIIKNAVFQVDSDIVQKARELDNYLIINTNNPSNTNNICAIYFSSNFIYYPNNEASFNSAIFEKNKFEWWNLRHPKASKHIFLRDIYKQWYLHGINSELNSIEKLFVFLEQETKGYHSYLIGSSAGGFAAIILGSMLKAEKIYSFNNQFFLTDLLENTNELTNPILFRERNNPDISKFFNIKSYLKNPSAIYYFHSNKSEWDVNQYEEVRDLKINLISVNTKLHGIPILKNNLVFLFNFSEERLIDLTKRRLNPIYFSIKIVGLWQTIYFVFSIIPQIYNKIFFKSKKKKSSN